MKILQVIDNLNVGGAEILLKDLCAAWRGSDLDVSVYLLNSSNGWIEDQLRAGGTRIVHSGLSSLYSTHQVSRLVRHLSQTQYDIVHVHLFPAQLWVRLAVRILNLDIPIVTTEHNTWNRRRRTMFRQLDRFMYRRFNAVACISQAAADNLREWLAPDHCEICVIPNGIDTARFSGRHSSPRPRTQQPILLCVGSLTARKNQTLMIRALAEIPDATLLLAGNGPARADLEETARELGVRSRVQFLGARSDIPELLSSADIYVQPSIVDGFCIAAVEAMSAGLPVVASDIPGMRDVVGPAGILLNPNAPEELAARIRELISHPALCQELGERARQRAAEFTIEKTAERYRRLYKSLGSSVARNQHSLISPAA